MQEVQPLEERRRRSSSRGGSSSRRVRFQSTLSSARSLTRVSFTAQERWIKERAGGIKIEVQEQQIGPVLDCEFARLGVAVIFGNEADPRFDAIQGRIERLSSCRGRARACWDLSCIELLFISRA